MTDISIEYDAVEILDLENSKRFSIVDVNLTKLTDAQLLERYAGGDENAFRELVARYKNSLYTFLWRFLNKQELIEDVFQETFLQLVISIASYDTTRPLGPWLFTIAANKARDALRKLQLTPVITIGTIADSKNLSFDEMLNVIAGNDTTPQDELEKDEDAYLVQEVISIMPEHLREILLLAYFNGFSYKQIAEILNIPVGTVKSRLHSAVGYFAKLWKSLSQEQNTEDIESISLKK
jgi:RNA polymerase sigma-70 factor, ECF subfamily